MKQRGLPFKSELSSIGSITEDSALLPSTVNSFIMHMPTEGLESLFLDLDNVKSPISFAFRPPLPEELGESKTPQFTSTLRPQRRALALEVQQFLQEIKRPPVSTKSKENNEGSKLDQLQRHIELINRQQAVMMSTIRSQMTMLRRLRRRPLR
jgi:hypothetical protein